MYSEDVVELYELEHRDFDADLHLYRSYAMMTGGPVLELGCGTGRLMAPLVEAGYAVTGVDSSAAMLHRARVKLESLAKTGWLLVESDLGNLSSLRAAEYGLAYCALNTWAHLVDPADALAVLRAVHRVLRPAGLLVLDLEDPEGRTPGRGELLLAGVFEDGDDLVIKTVATVYDPATGVDKITILWDRSGGGSVRRAVSQTRMRPYSLGELRALLALGGYAVEQVLGSWDMDPYQGRGDRLILVASRVGGS